jgi:hypothetical protein
MRSQKHPKDKIIIKNGLACQVDVAYNSIGQMGKIVVKT